MIFIIYFILGILGVIFCGVLMGLPLVIFLLSPLGRPILDFISPMIRSSLEGFERIFGVIVRVVKGKRRS